MLNALRSSGNLMRPAVVLGRGGAVPHRSTELSIMSVLATRLRERIASRTARTGVVGLGYVGLPLAVELARTGSTTTGIDLDARKVAGDQRRRRPTSPMCRPPTCGSSRRRAASTRPPISPSSRSSTRSTSACRRRCARPRTPTCRYIVSAVEIDRQASAARACSSCSSRRPIRARPRKWCSRCSKRADSRRARISSWRSRPNASIRATRRSRRATSRRSSAA